MPPDPVDDRRSPSARPLESLLAFWADAGVDACVQDAPLDRLAEGVRRQQAAPRNSERSAPPTSESPSAQPGSSLASTSGSRAAAPTDLAAAIAEARRAAASARDLEALAAAIAAYEGCALRTLGAKTAVFARGNPSAPVMIIGEGPGADEDAQGAPFVGRAGKLLDRMLAAAGLSDQVFITNTVFWRPPGNRNPSAEEQASCAPFVERAIALVAPKVLVLAGGVAAKALLGRQEGILSLRGRWFDWHSQDAALKIPALPILHPAFLLRQPAAKKKAWEDMLALMSRLDRDL